MRAFAPGTVANVSCGFDIFGFALESPGDTVVARRRDEPGVSLSAIHG
ncbi:MAG: homoserine kinase, partial [Gemmatimonadetes bacterium]|nr:homoserine kinase [Gemmatimonadota bacterium]